MIVFNYSFEVAAPITAVSAFHHDTRALKKLSPPPIFAQIHSYEPLKDGSKADFTLWFGPFPVHWVAVHSDVSENGFTDTQVSGPLKFWQHTHHFTAVSASKTRVTEHIEYAHATGLRGIISRLLFNKPALYMLFTARKMLTRRGLTAANISK